jgi:20S proteasome alpha/beta subunit
MTTVAYRDGVMAADKNMGGYKGQVTKVYRVGDCLVGCSGDNFATLLKVVDWMQEGAEEDSKPELGDSSVHILLVDSNGEIFLYNNDLYPMPLEQDFFAVGSGMDYAMGAMAMGASAADAVRVASQFDPGTGPKVDCLTLE